MTSKFGLILAALDVAFKNAVSENDYFMLVQILRNYSESRCDAAVEQAELAAIGWPKGYHPCDHMERIRFGFAFGKDDNAQVQELIAKINALV